MTVSVPPSVRMQHLWPVADKVDFARRKSNQPNIAPFATWLPVITPEWQWDVPHLQAIISAFQRMIDGENDRLMVFMPPRHAKSETLTVRGAAYVIEQNPATNVIVAAYNHTLAQRFSRKTRRIVRERVGISDERSATDEWETMAGGTYRAVGIGGGITGMGGNWIFIDDPIKNRAEADSQTFRDRVWDWYTDDLLTRREPDAKIVLIMTRWHMDDLAGRIIEANGGDWETLHLPAIAMLNDPLGRTQGDALWPERYPPEFFADIQENQERTFWALYQGMPQSDSGVIFQREWWDGRARFHLSGHQAKDVAARFQFWDTAESLGNTSAYTACVTLDLLHDDTLRVIDVHRARYEMPDLVTAIEQQAERFNTDGLLERGYSAIVLEYASSGRGAYQTIIRYAPDWIAQRLQPFTPRLSKEDRARMAAPWVSAGLVAVPHPALDVPWLHDFMDEVLTFPRAKFADQVDAFSMGVNYLDNFLSDALNARGRTHVLDHAAD